MTKKIITAIAIIHIFPISQNFPKVCVSFSFQWALIQ